MATGHGGKRAGAGRPKGAKNTLPLGSVRALIATTCAQKRLTSEATPEERAVVQHAFERVADVLDESVSAFGAAHVLKAAAMVADAVAGKQADKVEVRHRVTLADLGIEDEADR